MITITKDKSLFETSTHPTVRILNYREIVDEVVNSMYLFSSVILFILILKPTYTI